MKTAMKLSCFLILLKVVTAIYSTDVEGDPDLESYLREAIENFREQMKEGIEAINMPVLDPLELKNLDINVYENLATMTLKISQLNVRCLSNFNVTYLKPNLEELYLGINLTLPEVYMNGHYTVEGRMLKILPIYGQGKFDFNATGICIAGEGQLHFANDTLQMGLLALDLSWKNLIVFMEKFLGGGDFSDVLQRIIPGVGRDVFQVYKPLILDKLQSAFTEKINEKLNDPVVKDIVKGIFSKHHNFK